MKRLRERCATLPLVAQPRRPRAARQRGQAMVEFALVALVLILLIAGGIELASAALNSRASRDASLRAADEWSGVLGRYGYVDAAATVPAGVEPYFLSDQPGGSTPGLYGLGDHDNGAHAMPACNDDVCSTPDTGLPPRCLASVSPGAPGQRDRDLCLFNPKPLDVTACVPAGGAGPGGACMSALFDALPPLHAALRSLYELRCMNADLSAELPCAPGVPAWLLRLPGRFDPASDAVTLGLLDGANEAAGSLETFQLQCAAPGRNFTEPDPLDPAAEPVACERGAPGDCACDSHDLPADVCWTDEATPRPLACRVRVMVRYRHQFYALLASPGGFFDSSPLPDSALAVLDLGRSNAAGVPVGGLGSEVTSQETGSADPQYFKLPWRTFQGCAESQTVPAGGSLRAPVSACN